MKLSHLIVPLLFIVSCTTKEQEEDFTVEGVKPIYVQQVSGTTIESKAAQNVQYGSKLYIKDNYVFIVDQAQGVHVYDNTNPSNPSNVRFFEIPGVTDIAIKNNVMYANQNKDILAIDISDIANINELSRQENVFDADINQFPIGYNGYFECVDNSKGVVVVWEEALLENPKCFR